MQPDEGAYLVKRRRLDDAICHDTYNVVYNNICMISPLPNVRQANSFVVQDTMQRRMTSETTKNFSIVAAIQTSLQQLVNKSKGKHCEHCDREDHTTENCRTLKFYCKHCDKRGHIGINAY